MTETVPIQTESRAYQQMQERLGDVAAGSIGQVIPVIPEKDQPSNGLRRELSRSEVPVLPKGTLIHNTRYNREVVERIANGGLQPFEATGNKNERTGSAVAGAVYAYEVPDDMTLEQYGEFCAKGVQGGQSSRVKSSMGLENSMYPATASELRQQRNATTVAFIIDRNAVSTPKHPEYSGFHGRAAAFIGDIPPDAISGIVLGQQLAGNPEVTQDITNLFPGLAIFDHHGQRLLPAAS